MRMNSLLVLAISLVAGGCVTTETQDDVTPKASNVVCLVIGMETSQRFGSCPGCKKDSNRVSELLRNEYGYPVKLLQSEAATRDTVIKEIESSIAQAGTDGLFILYYSGHGGSEYLGYGTSEPEGADSNDEYLCLYDSYLLDDEIWNMISKSKGRVFCCFDACHSATMFRSISSDISIKDVGVTLSVKNVRSSGGFNLSPRATVQSARGIRMLCWGGCKESEYSYGSVLGGVLTNSMLNRWKMGISYDDLWSLMVSDVSKAQPTQHPVATRYGDGFLEVFR